MGSLDRMANNPTVLLEAFQRCPDKDKTLPHVNKKRSNNPTIQETLGELLKILNGNNLNGIDSDQGADETENSNIINNLKNLIGNVKKNINKEEDDNQISSTAELLAELTTLLRKHQHKDKQNGLLNLFDSKSRKQFLDPGTSINAAKKLKNKHGNDVITAISDDELKRQNDNILNENIGLAGDILSGLNQVFNLTILLFI